MKRTEYKPKAYKELVERLLQENHKICSENGLPNTFYQSTKGVDVLSNFDDVYRSFVEEFPYSRKMSDDVLVFTFKILLQQQLDSYWYSGFKKYMTNLEIYNDSDLVCFEDVNPLFNYLKLSPGKKYVSTVRKLFINITNSPLRNSSGMFLPYAPVPMYNFLNRLCSDLDIEIVVTNVLRSQEYQNMLLEMGHITPIESSHLYGYTVDIEQGWFRKNRPSEHQKILNHLHILESDGQISFVDYGSIWHICLSPGFLHLYMN